MSAPDDTTPPAEGDDDDQGDELRARLEPPSFDRMRPVIGEVDALEVSLGLRGYGKSTILSARIRELRARVGGYVIGHSLGARIGRKLPAELGGHELPIRYHETLRKMEVGLREHPEDWHIKVGGSADDVIQYARALSLKVRERAWIDAGKVGRWSLAREMDGISAPPIILLIDEGIAVDAAAGNAQGKAEHAWFREWLFSLRHEHIALFWAIQNSSARSWVLVEQATCLYAFRIRHRWAIECVRAAGATEEDVRRLRYLERGERVVIR